MTSPCDVVFKASYWEYWTSGLHKGRYYYWVTLSIDKVSQVQRVTQTHYWTVDLFNIWYHPPERFNIGYPYQTLLKYLLRLWIWSWLELAKLARLICSSSRNSNCNYWKGNASVDFFLLPPSSFLSPGKKIRQVKIFIADFYLVELE